MWESFIGDIPKSKLSFSSSFMKRSRGAGGMHESIIGKFIIVVILLTVLVSHARHQNRRNFFKSVEGDLGFVIGIFASILYMALSRED